MAFMNQDRKAVIAAELKKVMPKGWKYTLRVQHHSTIIMTIQSAPVDLHGLCKYENKSRGYIQLNEFYLERAYDDAKILEVLLAAKAALNTGNWYDGIDPDSKFVVFSTKNPFVHFHSIAMSRYFEAVAR